MHGLPLWLACSRFHIQAEGILNIDKVMFVLERRINHCPLPHWYVHQQRGSVVQANVTGPSSYWFTFPSLQLLLKAQMEITLSKHLFICLPLIVLTQLLYNKKKDFTRMVISRPDQVGRFHSFSTTLLRSRTMEITLHFCDASEFYNLLPSPFPYSTTLSWHK